MSTIFISHSSVDKDLALDLQRRLEERKFDSLFLDVDPEKGIQAGISWERTLYAKLRACRAIVAIVSDDYLKSYWCFAEVALARMEGKKLIVIRSARLKEQTLPSILKEAQNVDIKRQGEDGWRSFWSGLKTLGLKAEAHREWDTETCPYPGLAPFEEHHAAVYFGRDDEIHEGVALLEKMQQNEHPHLAMVLGSSGSGKSSLVRAGMIPKLRDNEARWIVVPPFRPGADPIRRLSHALATAFGRSSASTPDEEEIAARLRAFRPARLHGDPIVPLAAPASRPPGPAEASDRGPGSESPPADARETTASANAASQERARAKLMDAISLLEKELSAGDRSVATSLRALRAHLEAGTHPSTSPLPEEEGNPLLAFASMLQNIDGPSDAAVVIVVDQFEELLGFDADRGAPADHFLRLLRDAVNAEHSCLYVVGTMRSDYLGEFQSARPLLGVPYSKLSVGPMDEDQLRQVIVGPSEICAFDLEPELISQLLADTQNSGALPLLAFVLKTMWERCLDFRGVGKRQDRLIEKSEYQELGGLEGAIAQVADAAWEAASLKGDKSLLRNTFLRMARANDEGTSWIRQPLPWDEVQEEARPMIQHFVDQRLLQLNDANSVEVVHESLFRSWGKLAGWLKENASGLALLREIHLQAERWQEAETEEDKESFLWPVGRLAHANQLRERGVLVLRELDLDFIEASEAAVAAAKEAEERARREKVAADEALKREKLERERAVERAEFEAKAEQDRRDREAALERAAEQEEHAEAQRRAAARQRRIAVAAGIAAVACLAIGAYAAIQSRLAAKSTSVAQAMAAQMLIEVEPAQSAVDAVAAAVTSESLVLTGEPTPPEVDRSLFSVVSAMRIGRVPYDTLHGHEGPINDTAMSSDGTRLVSVGSDGRAILWDLDMRIDIAEVSSPGHEFTRAEMSEQWGAIVVADNGRRRRSQRATLFAVDFENQSLTDLGLSPRRIQDLGILDDGTIIVATSGASPLTAITVSGDVIPIEIANLPDEPVSFHSVLVFGDEAIAFGGKWAAPIEIGSPVELENIEDLLGPVPETSGVWMSAVVEKFVIGHHDGSVSTSTDVAQRAVVDESTLTERDFVKRIDAHRERVTAAAIDPLNRGFVSGSRDMTFQLWEPNGDPIGPTIRGHKNAVTDIEFLPDGTTFLTAGADGDIKFWRFPSVGQPHPRGVAAFALTNGGDSTVSVAGDGLVQLEGPAFADAEDFNFDEFEGDLDSIWVTTSANGDWSAFRGGIDDADPARADEVVLVPKNGVRQILKVEGGRATAGAFSSTGSEFAFVRDRKILVLFSMVEGAFTDEWAGEVASHTNGSRRAIRFNNIVFAQSGDFLLASTTHGVARFDFPLSESQYQPVYSGREMDKIDLDPDGQRWVATGQRSHHALLGAVGEDKKPKRLEHRAAVVNAGFCCNGKYIVTGAQDGVLQVWDLDGKRKGGPIKMAGDIASLEVADDAFVAAVEIKGADTIRRVDLSAIDRSTNEWIDEICNSITAEMIVRSGHHASVFDRCGWDLSPDEIDEIYEWAGEMGGSAPST